MNNDSFSQRLKEIREKYGANVKDTAACLGLREKQNTQRSDMKVYDKYEKYTSDKKYEHTCENFRTVKNESSVIGFSKTYLNNELPQRDTLKRYDSINFTKNTNQISRDDRLKQIQKIRASFAQTRKQAIDDWSREVQKSKNKKIDIQKPKLTLNSKYNTNSINPQDTYKRENKEVYALKQELRNRTQSSYNSKQIQDPILKEKLKRNYDYNYTLLSSHKKQASLVDQKPLKALNRKPMDKENIATSIIRQFDYSSTSSKLYSRINNQSGTSSPIKGLNKLDSVQKFKHISNTNVGNVASQLSGKNYDLGNIDNIQQRIQKILGKK